MSRKYQNYKKLLEEYGPPNDDAKEISSTACV